MSAEVSPVILRALLPTDVDTTLRWHNDPSLYATLAGSFRAVSRATEEEWLRHVSQPAPDALNLGIVERATGNLVGCVYLRDIDQESRSGELHVFLGEPAARGRGLGEAACQAMIWHAFLELGLQRIYLKVLPENGRAIRLYERLGFTRDGLHPGAVVKDGVPRDLLAMSITPSSATFGIRLP
jgi:RimJ/RimL family protein N-acetyltransferase